jgi:hypothetical protein
MLNNLRKWCHKLPGLAALLILFLALIIVVMGVIGLIGWNKLNIANTNLWQTRQNNLALANARTSQAAEYETAIAQLQAELLVYREAETEAARLERARQALIDADAMTPVRVWKYTTNGTLTMTTSGEVNVRPAPAVASGISFGKLNRGITIRTDYFYSRMAPNPDGSLPYGNWIGVPVETVSRHLDAAALEDPDGIVWISMDYLIWSDWLRNYTPEQVNLR